MDWQHIFFSWTTVGAFFTLCIFSFLYKDNIFYKIAENVVVGVAAGYFFIILVYTGFFPKFYNPVFIHDGAWFELWKGKWWYIIPGFLGILMYFRFHQKLLWLSRYPMSIYLGIAAGIAIPLELQAQVLRQLESTILPMGISSGQLINNTLIVIMVISSLVYFFFSASHKGAVGKVATFGIWVIMVGFGASFGYTVMARISLLIGRIQFLLGTWLGLLP